MVSDFPKKQKKEDENLLFKGLVAISIVLIFVLIMANFRLYQKKKDLASQIKNYSDELKRIEQDNNKLKKEIDNTANLDYIEKIAREENNMKKPGEKVVSFILPKDAEVNKPEKNKTWFASILDGLVSIFK